MLLMMKFLTYSLRNKKKLKVIFKPLLSSDYKILWNTYLIVEDDVKRDILKLIDSMPDKDLSDTLIDLEKFLRGTLKKTVNLREAFESAKQKNQDFINSCDRLEKYVSISKILESEI